MPSKFLPSLTVPGEVSPNRALIVGMVVMLIVFAVDVLTPTNIRLHLLYIFPLACIALHCARLSLVIAAGFMSGLMQLITFFIHHVPLLELITDTAVAFAATFLIVILSRSVRQNFLVIANLADRDSLTGLWNRRSFEDAANKEIARQVRYGGFFSLVIIDLDKFKELNDSKGHFAGDLALKLVAKVLNEHTRNVDVVARLGGDEFGILMPNTSEKFCSSVCRHLTDEIGEKMADGGFTVTASIGFSTFELSPESVSNAVHLADKAMYAVKTGKAERGVSQSG